MDGAAYLKDVTYRFSEARRLCDRALAQVPFERWGERLDPESNSLVTLILHLAGNMRSRWTDFLTSDGEKHDRNRDAEFEDAAHLSREALLERWESGWKCLFDGMASLTEDDLERVITIRAEPHTVVAAVDRQLTHAWYHTGQMVFLAKHLTGGRWQTLSVPRGGSGAFNAARMGKPPGA